MYLQLAILVISIQGNRMESNAMRNKINGKKKMCEKSRKEKQIEKMSLIRANVVELC